jgi:CheY-like chemotaxis protein
MADLTPPLILIIDDSTFERNLIRHALQAAGYRTLEAGDGHQGLDFLDRYRPNAVIADLLMPTMGGLELLEALRSQGLKIPVIMLMSGVQDEIRSRCLEEGAAAVLPKPVQSDRLLTTLTDVITL